AIAAVHDAGFVHRDVKPSNVLVIAKNQYENLAGARIKLLDFGIVTGPRFDEAQKLTHDNALLGTLEYMPPERIAGRPDTHAVAGDVYGLGATLFECLTGRVPYEGDPIEIVAKLTTSPSPSARSVRGDVPALLEPILQKAMHHDAHRRYKDAHDLE